MRLKRGHNPGHLTILATVLLGVAGAPALAQLTSAQLNYPPVALRAGKEGAVGYKVKLAKDGRVTGCSVTQTSGSADLDQQTCAQLRQTARFKPAVNAEGKPVTSTFTGRLRWSIPRPAVEPTSPMPAAPPQ